MHLNYDNFYTGTVYRGNIAYQILPFFLKGTFCSSGYLLDSHCDLIICTLNIFKLRKCDSIKSYM